MSSVRRYPTPIYPNADIGRPGWRIVDYTLCWSLGLDSNHDAQVRVAAEIETVPGMGEHLTLDSEHGCFLAYADSRYAIEALAFLIADLVASGPHPDAVPANNPAGPGFTYPDPLTVEAFDTPPAG